MKIQESKGIDDKCAIRFSKSHAQKTYVKILIESIMSDICLMNLAALGMTMTMRD